MAIARILGFEHLPSGASFTNGSVLNAAGTCWGLGAGDLGATASLPAGTNGISLRVEGKKLACGKWATVNTIAAGGYSTLTLSSFTKETAAKKIIIGFRYEIAKVCANSMPMMVIGNKASAAETAYGTVASLFWQATTNAVGDTGYCEIVFDFVNNTIIPYRDGNPQAAVAMNGLTAATFKDHFWGVGRKDVTQNNVTTAAEVFFYLSDIYCVVDTGDTNDPYRDRLGPITVSRIPAATVSGDWVASNAGTLASVVNSGKTTSENLNTPVVNNNTDVAPLTMVMDLSAFATSKLLAVDATVGAYHDGGVAGNLKAGWKINGVADTDVAITVPSVTALLNDLRGGNKVNPNGITAIELTLTPTN